MDGHSIVKTERGIWGRKKKDGHNTGTASVEKTGSRYCLHRE